MALTDFLFGSNPKLKKISTLNPQQKATLNSLLGSISPDQFNVGKAPLYQSGSNYLQNLLSGSPEAFENFERPYRQMFEQELIPSIAERFSGLGAGSQRSSAFQQALAQAGTGLASQLAALRSGLQMQALPQALGYAQLPGQMGLNIASLGLGTPSFAYGMRPASTGVLGGLLPGLGSSFGMGLGRLLGF